MAPPNHIIATPRWLLSLRYTQITLAIIILSISSYGLYWLELSAWGFALFMSLATITIAIYNITTQVIPTWSVAYNYWVILGLDIFGVICWLSAMAALAATRASFDIPTTINQCVHTPEGGVCDRKLMKRAVAGYGYLAAMSAAAGISALEMILFAVILTIFGIHLTRYRSSRLNPSTVQQEYKLGNATLAGTGGVGYAPLAQPQQQYAQPQQQYMQPQPYEQYTQQQPQQWAQQPPQGSQHGQPMQQQGQPQQYYQ